MPLRFKFLRLGCEKNIPTERNFISEKLISLFIFHNLVRPTEIKQPREGDRELFCLGLRCFNGIGGGY